MTSLRIIIPFFTLLLLLITSSEAREFQVGGNKSSRGNPWPSVLSLNEWAATNRFRVGDTLSKYSYDHIHASQFPLISFTNMGLNFLDIWYSHLQLYIYEAIVKHYLLRLFVHFLAFPSGLYVLFLYFFLIKLPILRVS